MHLGELALRDNRKGNMRWSNFRVVDGIDGNYIISRVLWVIKKEAVVWVHREAGVVGGLH
jgi:hypothetical protein